MQVGDRQSLQSSRAAAEEAAKEAQRQRDTKQGSLGVVLEQVRTAVYNISHVLNCVMFTDGMLV
jgi:hypothetical protein